MKTKDNSRKWMWMFLAALVLLQTYFVWELLAVFALFAAGFAAIAFVIGSLYMLQRGWVVAGGGVGGTQHPDIGGAQAGLGKPADMGRRAVWGAGACGRGVVGLLTCWGWTRAHAETL